MTISFHLLLVLGTIIFFVILLWIFIYLMENKIFALKSKVEEIQHETKKLTREVFWLRKGREGANPEIAEDW